MKVLQINVFHHRLGGTETVYFSTTELLTENGNDVIHFALKWEKNIPSLQGKFFPESKESRKGFLRPVSNIINYFYNFDAVKKIEALIQQEKPDIAQVHLFWGQITPSVLPVLKKYHIPIIFTIHEYRMVCPAYTFRNGRGKVCEDCKGKHFYKCFANNCCKGNRLMSAMMAAEQYFRNTFFHPSKYIDGLIYVSHFAKKMHEQYMPELRKIKNTTLYNLAECFEDSSKLCHPNEKYLLYFGRLSYEKGVQTLLYAMKKFPKYKLKIVGSGDLDSALKGFVNKENLNNIEFLGFKTGDPLKKLVKEAFFVIVPSEWYENNPMTIIESYSFAVPVIGASIGGIPEIVDDGRTGYLFKSGDIQDLQAKIETAFNLTENQYANFRENALSFAKKNFNREFYYPKLMSFYKEVLGK